MEAGVAATDSSDSASEVSSSAGIATAESSEIYSYRHENGEIASGTLADLARCAMLGSLPEEQRAILARQFMIGQQELQTDEEQKKEETNKNHEDDTEEIGKISEKNTTKADAATEGKPQEFTTGSIQEELIKPGHQQTKISQTPTSQVTGMAALESGVNTGQPDRESKSSIENFSLEESQYESTAASKGERAVKEEKPPVVAVKPSGETEAITNKLDLSAPVTAGRNEGLPFSEEFPLPKQIYKSEYPDKVRRSPGELGTDGEIKSDVNLQLQLEAMGGMSIEPDMLDYEHELPSKPLSDLYDISEQENLNEMLHSESWFEDEEMNMRKTLETEKELYTPDDLLYIAGSEVPGLDSPIQQIEETAEQLVDRLNELTMQEDETAEAILDEIIHKIELPGLATDSKVIELETEEHGEMETEETEAEIEKLFIQLFNLLEIDYSPELIHSFVNLSMKKNDRILYKKSEDEKIPDETGTHEIIDHLFIAFGSIKKTLLQAYVIGRSALQLCIPQSEFVT